jgi:hypothetical protein
MENKQNNTQKIGGKFYNNLLSHCSKQYKHIALISKAYVINGQVYAIDYSDATGMEHIASNTAIAERIITFKPLT